MKVKDLIKKLQSMPEEAEVVHFQEGGYSVYEQEILEVELYKGKVWLDRTI